MADKATKLTEEELQTLANIKKSKENLSNEFSNLSVMKIRYEDRYTAAKNFLYELDSAEAKLAKELEEKYGKGTINVETGEFTPVS